jgi:hypothetical protein
MRSQRVLVAVCFALTALLLGALAMCNAAARSRAAAEARALKFRAELETRTECPPKATTRDELVRQFIRDLEALDEKDPSTGEKVLRGDYPPFYGARPPAAGEIGPQPLRPVPGRP